MLFTFFTQNINCIRPKVGETVKERLKRLYFDHKEYSYRDSHYIMYLDADCDNSNIRMIYSSIPYPFPCGGTELPSQIITNTEHVVPRAFFKSQLPMLSDEHHLYSAPAKANNQRGNLPFSEFPYSQCKEWCNNLTCENKAPPNPDDYSCLNKNKLSWMPRVEDRGMIARSIFYFMTMYDMVPIEQVGDIKILKKWNNQYPPSQFEIARNNKLNKTQGNRNPYIDDFKLVDQAFP